MSLNNQVSKRTLKLMRRPGLALLAATLVVTLILTWDTQESGLDNPITGMTGPGSEVEQLLHSQAPFTFVENKGQWDSRAKFVAQNGSMTIWVEKDGIALQLEKQEDGKQKKGVVTRLTFVGASDAVRLEGEKIQGGRRSFFVGNDRSKWQSGVAGYTQVLYQGLYPGIDLRLRPNEGRLEYDVLLRPGADLEQVVIECSGTDGLKIEDDGSLLMTTALGDIRQKLPTTWYELPSGEKQPVACNYDLLDDEHFGFSVPDLNRNLALVIDPGLEYSTYFGGSGSEQSTNVRWSVDEEGNIYLTERTTSQDFPVTEGAYETGFSGGMGDVYVMCFNPNLAGSEQLVWSTFLGGSGRDDGLAVIIDGSGNVIVVGGTGSEDFPTTSNAYDTTYNGGSTDAFLTVLDATGSTLLYSTLLGGGEEDRITDVGIESSNNIALIGDTASPDFPVTPAAYDTSYNGSRDFFVASLDLNLSEQNQLVWSTFLGGGGEEFAGSSHLLIDSAGAIIVAGETESRNFPTTPGAFSEDYNGGFSDMFVARFDPQQTSHAQLSYSTFLGGSAADFFLTMLPEGPGILWLGCQTLAADFPVTAGAYDETYGGGSDGCFLRLDLNRTGKDQLTYSSFLGGATFWDLVTNIVIDDSGRIILVGQTGSSDFPTTAGAFDRTYAGGFWDVFVTRLNLERTGSAQLDYSTLLGGDTWDWPTFAALDESGSLLIAGTSASGDFPTTPGAFDETHNGREDIFFAKLVLEPTTQPAKTLFSSLRGQNEVVPVATPGSGSGRYTLNADSTMLDYEITVENLLGKITAVHFHSGPADSNGPVVKTILDNGLVAGDTTFSGVWKSADSQPLTPALVAALCAETVYINVQTDAFPDGEIRGQLSLDPLPSVARAQPGPFYATLGRAGELGGSLINIDPQTGAGELIAPIDRIGRAVTFVPAMAINSRGQMFVKIDQGPRGFGGHVPLYRIDAATGGANFVGYTTQWLEGLAFDLNDVLYGIADPGASLVVIDENTAVVSAIGKIGVNVAGMAFDPTDGTLWASTGGNRQPPDRIYTIDITTAKATLVGTTGLGSPIPGLHFDDNGNLYGVVGGGKRPNDLVAIDKSTGKGTVIGPTGFTSVSSLAMRHSVVQGPQISLNAKVINLGNVELGKSVSNTITVTNYGTADLSVTAISSSGAPFVLTNLPPLPMAILPHQAATFEVTFSPTSEGLDGGSLIIDSNDANDLMHETSVMGRGVEISVAETGVIFASTGNLSEGQLLTIDPTSGSATLVGETGLHTVPALAINTQGEIFAVDDNRLVGDLYRIDATSGAAIEVGSMGLEGRIDAMAFDGQDVLYGVSNGLPIGGFRGIKALYRIDTATGALTEIGPLETSFAGLAFNPRDGILWASTGTESDQIFILDHETGQATLVGQTGLGDGTFDLAFDAAGNLYGTKGGNDTNNTLISIDKETGAGTVIGPIDYFSVHGLATRLPRSVIISVEAEAPLAALPTEFTLAQNYPNPFNPSTTIRYDLPQPVHVKLVIYDILGRTVRTLVDEEQTAGVRQKIWDGRNEAGVPVATGLYLYRIQAGDFVKSRKLMLIK